MSADLDPGRFADPNRPLVSAPPQIARSHIGVDPIEDRMPEPSGSRVAVALPGLGFSLRALDEDFMVK